MKQKANFKMQKWSFIPIDNNRDTGGVILHQIKFEVFDQESAKNLTHKIRTTLLHISIAFEETFPHQLLSFLHQF